MATKNMPGTPKARSVSRPAQGHGKGPVTPGKPKNLRPVKATPSRKSAPRRVGSLVTS